VPLKNQIFSDKTFLTVFVDGEFKGEMKRRDENKFFSLLQRITILIFLGNLLIHLLK
jgi:hypothetical protein